MTLTRIARFSLVLLVASCGATDPHVPWDKADIVREVTSDLRRFEHLTSDFTEVEVLAWRTQVAESKPIEFPPTAPVAAPVERTRSDSVLLWARIASKADSTWMVIQAYRASYQENRWRRVVSNRELRYPPPPLWPGETPDGTWHGFQRFNRAPASDEICRFAEVAFLRPVRDDWRTVSGALQTTTWSRVTGARPACEIVW